jgi:UDP-N-acetylglucosamine 2-epimerase (non-hydrolysing)
MQKLMVIYGTRPEVIKLAPLIQEIGRYPRELQLQTCFSGQHREMVAPLLQLFDLKPDHELNLMEHAQGLEHITTAVLRKFTDILRKEQPDWVIVQGDTTTAMAAAMSAFYARIRIGHVEAGLRTGDMAQPFPEEANRVIIDRLSDACFAHSEHAHRTLVGEGVPESRIRVTGNTVIDAVQAVGRMPLHTDIEAVNRVMADRRKLVLITAHRRENHGTPMVDICHALRALARKYHDRAVFIYPVHLNPAVQTPVLEHLGGIENMVLTPPLEYEILVHLIKRAHFVVTDSGGLQEEAPAFGKPVLILREVTERPEVVEAGTARIVGTDRDAIVSAATALMDDPGTYDRMARVACPYGDGTASKKITDYFLREGGVSSR